MLNLSKLETGDAVRVKDGHVYIVHTIHHSSASTESKEFPYVVTFMHAKGAVRYYSESGTNMFNDDINILEVMDKEDRPDRHEDEAPAGQEVSATGFKKWDKGKAPLNYLLDVPLINDEVAFIRQFGDQKYGRLNWKLSDDPERYIAAALRHIQLNGDQELLDDDESGRPHLAHAICCLQFFAEIKLEQKKAKKNETTQDN